jgi:hypothetical protein
MQGLLSPVRQPEPPADERPIAVTPAPAVVIPPTDDRTFAPQKMQTLLEIQQTLKQYGICAEIPEIVEAIMQTVTARPALCRGLIAAYLLETEERS